MFDVKALPQRDLSSPDWKVLPRTNTLTYLASSSVAKKKGSTTLTPEPNVIKLDIPVI
jgi:hypothetical protein